MTGIALSFAVGTAVTATPGLPVWGLLFLLISVLGLVSSLGGGVRWGLLNEILSKDGYLLGRSVFNMANGLSADHGLRDGRRPGGGALAEDHAGGRGGPVSRGGPDHPIRHDPPGAEGHRPALDRADLAYQRAAVVLAPAPDDVPAPVSMPNGLIVGCESLYVSYARTGRVCSSPSRRSACSWAT